MARVPRPVKDPRAAPGARRLPLPAGFGLALDPSVRAEEGGRVLIGGSPRRVARLSEQAAAELGSMQEGGAAGERARLLARELIDAGMANPRPPSVGAGEVTVVIPVHERAAELDRCLGALGAGPSVLVVDDGSPDAESVAAVSARHGARLRRLESCGGPAAARNAGLADVDTELVAFLDSDCEPPPGWLDPLVAHLADPEVGVVAPRVLPVEREHPGVRERYATARSPLDMGGAEGQVTPGGRISYLPTAAIVVRREALSPPFDTDLRFGEDIDMIWRLLDGGWRVRYEPSVVVRHAEPDSWAALLRRRRDYGTSAAPLSRRHGDRVAPARCRPLPGAVSLLLLSRLLPGAIAVGALGALLRAVRGRAVSLPVTFSVKSFAVSTAQDLVGLGRCATRIWWPVLALAAASRRGRRAAAALLLLPPLLEWARSRPPVDPVRWTIASVAEDVAYGSGVWKGCARERTLRPVLPVLDAEERPVALELGEGQR